MALSPKVFKHVLCLQSNRIHKDSSKIKDLSLFFRYQIFEFKKLDHCNRLSNSYFDNHLQIVFSFFSLTVCY